MCVTLGVRVWLMLSHSLSFSRYLARWPTMTHATLVANRRYIRHSDKFGIILRRNDNVHIPVE